MASTLCAPSWARTYAVAAFRGFCPQQFPRLLMHPPHQRKDVCSATYDARVHRRAKSHSMNFLALPQATRVPIRDGPERQ
jgi:hypothetical protein